MGTTHDWEAGHDVGAVGVQHTALGGDGGRGVFVSVLASVFVMTMEMK